MGLNITAFRHVRPAPDAHLEKDEDRFCMFYNSAEFAAQASDLDLSVPYALLSYADALRFRAGSYSEPTRAGLER